MSRQCSAVQVKEESQTTVAQWTGTTRTTRHFDMIDATRNTAATSSLFLTTSLVKEVKPTNFVKITTQNYCITFSEIKLFYIYFILLFSFYLFISKNSFVYLVAFYPLNKQENFLIFAPVTCAETERIILRGI